MSTPDTIKAQLRLLLSNANETTKAEDATLTEANETLIAGYNQGGGNNGEINLQEKTITENGIYRPSVGYDGFSKVTVNVPTSGGGSGDSGNIAGYTRVYGECLIQNHIIQKGRIL